MSNLKLLSSRNIQVKDLPFEDLLNQDKKVESQALDYNVVMPIDAEKKIGEFTFNCKFECLVPKEDINKLLKKAEANRGYLLNVNALTSKLFAENHPKSLDKATLKCKLTNVTKTADGVIDEFDKLCKKTTRLFFNKEMIELGQILVQVGDVINIQFYALDPDDTELSEQE